jgi:urease accessory protein
MAHGSDANHAHSFANGLMHPLSGWDHWLSFMLLGVLAARVSALRKSSAALAATVGLFVVMMATGFAAASRYMGLPYPEFAIAGLLVTMGFVFVLMARPSLTVGIAIASAMGYVHGYVHGIELAGAMPAAAGMLSSSALLASLGALSSPQAWLYLLASLASLA